MTGTVLAETESVKVRGGQLYDKWYTVTGAEKPATSHALYPAERKCADEPKSNWRCKECHGWDYPGADGAYESGLRSTHIIRILDRIIEWRGKPCAIRRVTAKVGR